MWERDFALAAFFLLADTTIFATNRNTTLICLPKFYPLLTLVSSILPSRVVSSVHLVPRGIHPSYWRSNIRCPLPRELTQSSIHDPSPHHLPSHPRHPIRSRRPYILPQNQPLHTLQRQISGRTNREPGPQINPARRHDKARGTRRIRRCNPTVLLIGTFIENMARPLPRPMEAVYRCAGAVHYVAMVWACRGPAGGELLPLEPGDVESGVDDVAEEGQGATIRDTACAGGYVGPRSPENFQALEAHIVSPVVGPSHMNVYLV